MSKRKQVGDSSQHEKQDSRLQKICLTAIFNKATTTVDGGWTISFAVSQDEADQVIALSELRECLLQLAIIPIQGQ